MPLWLREEIQALSRPIELNARVAVVVGLLRDPAGRVLIGQRLAGTHMAGRWEFPGGKLEPGEAPRTALTRELGEELGVELIDAQRFMQLEHTYPDRKVSLDVWSVIDYRGTPCSREGQPLAWVQPAALRDLDLLEADAPIIDALCAINDGA